MKTILPPLITDYHKKILNSLGVSMIKKLLPLIAGLLLFITPIFPFPCFICKGKINEARLATLQCKHVYHLTCLCEWSAKNLSCLKCKGPILPEEIEFFTNRLKCQTSLPSETLVTLRQIISSIPVPKEIESIDSESE